MYFADKNLVRRGYQLKDLSIFGLKIFLPLEKNVTEYEQLYELCFINNQKSISSLFTCTLLIIEKAPAALLAMP